MSKPRRIINMHLIFKWHLLNTPLQLLCSFPALLWPERSWSWMCRHCRNNSIKQDLFLILDILTWFTLYLNIIIMYYLDWVEIDKDIFKLFEQEETRGHTLSPWYCVLWDEERERNQSITWFYYIQVLPYDTTVSNSPEDIGSGLAQELTAELMTYDFIRKHNIIHGLIRIVQLNITTDKYYNWQFY